MTTFRLLLKNSWIYAVFCCIGSGYFGLIDVIYGMHQRIVNNITFAIDPIKYQNKLNGQFTTLYNDFLSTIPSSMHIKSQRVGYFGFIPYPMIFLVDNYKPMPVYTSFAASTQTLSDLNTALYDELPNFLFVNYSTIDNRFVQQDDPMQQHYIANNYRFSSMTEYGAILTRTSSKNISSSVVDFSSVANCKIPCKISIPVGRPIIVKFKPYKTDFVANFIPPFFKLALEFEDSHFKEYRMSYTSAQVGVFANVLSMKYAYPKLIDKSEPKVKNIIVSCNSQYTCPESIKYKLDEIIYDN